MTVVNQRSTAGLPRPSERALRPRAADPGVDPSRRFVFVLEQALGHVTHGRNVERVAKDTPGIETRVIHVEQPSPSMIRRVPVLSTWTFEASWATRRALRRQEAQGPIDALFIHTQVAALFSVKAMRVVPTVISMDCTPINYDNFGYGHSRQGSSLERVKWELNRRALDAATRIVAFSRWTADSVTGDYHVPDHKVHVIAPGVDLNRFHPPAQRHHHVRPRVLFVGGDFARKGGKELLEAVRILEGRVELDIVTGSSPEGIPRDLPVRVHTGLHHDSDELFELYRQADIFALPASGECYGHVICEAMASRLPVVATPVGAIPELVKHGENGLLVPGGSAPAVADALRTLVERPDLRVSMGERGLLRARRDHDASRNVGKVLELMTRIARGRGVDQADGILADRHG